MRVRAEPAPCGKLFGQPGRCGHRHPTAAQGGAEADLTRVPANQAGDIRGDLAVLDEPGMLGADLVPGTDPGLPDVPAASGHPGTERQADRVLPGALDRAVANADTFFGQELPAVRAWSFGAEEASRIGQPVLAVLGARSREVTPAFDRRHELRLDWLPDVEPFVLPAATHLLHVHNPVGMATRLARFLLG